MYTAPYPPTPAAKLSAAKIFDGRNANRATAMALSVRCECGVDVPVSEGASGTVVQCACGRPLTVPSLVELRQQAGLRTVSAAIAIEDMLALRELPTLTSCAQCNGPSDEIVMVTAECEKVWSNELGGISWIIGFLVLGVWMLLLEQLREKKEHGRNLILHLPVRICRTCHWQLMRDPVASGFGILAITLLIGGAAAILLWTPWGAMLLPAAVIASWLEKAARNRQQTLIKKVLAQEPIYRELLEDYPDAKMILSV